MLARELEVSKMRNVQRIQAKKANFSIICFFIKRLLLLGDLVGCGGHLK